MPEEYLDYDNAGPKIVGSFKLSYAFEEESLIKEKYLPIELLHWAVMDPKYAYMVKDIIIKHPEYVNQLTVYGENVALIATAHDNVEVLKVLKEVAPDTLNFKAANGDHIIKVALDDQAEKCLVYLMSLDNLDMNVTTNSGLTLTHLLCLRGNSDILESLDEQGLTDYKSKDNTYQRSPLYFVVEDYLMHRNNWLFEMVLSNYRKEQLFEKDAFNMNVLEFVQSKTKGQPTIVTKVYSPLIFSLKAEMGIIDSE